MRKVSTSGDDEEERVPWASRREGGRTLGFEATSEGAGAGGCAIAAVAGMAGWLDVSECRAGLRS